MPALWDYRTVWELQEVKSEESNKEFILSMKNTLSPWRYLKLFYFEAILSQFSQKSNKITYCYDYN